MSSAHAWQRATCSRWRYTADDYRLGEETGKNRARWYNYNLIVLNSVTLQFIYLIWPNYGSIVDRSGFMTGLPVYSTGGVKRRPLSELFEPSVYTPRSRYVRDPWWWEYPHLKPYTPLSSTYRPPAKSYLRDSYLSPVKRTYLWGHHPIRPFSK